MTKQDIRSPAERLKVRSGISEQRLKVFALMIIGDDGARVAPEPLDAIGIRVISRRIDQSQLTGEFGQHTSHQQRPLSHMGFEIVGNNHSFANIQGIASN
jgi:hypothetical protein